MKTQTMQASVEVTELVDGCGSSTSVPVPQNLLDVLDAGRYAELLRFANDVADNAMKMLVSSVSRVTVRGKVESRVSLQFKLV